MIIGVNSMVKILKVVVCLLFVCPCFGQSKEKSKCVLFKDIAYSDGDTLKADLYLPLSYKSQSNPVVIFAHSFGDTRSWDHYTDWAKLAAEEGFIGILYSSRENQAGDCLDKLIKYLTAKARTYFVDKDKLSLYAGSGNVSVILPIANSDLRIKAALMYYGTARLENFRLDMPVQIVRAGFDNTTLNKQLDTLAFKAFQAYAPYTVVSFNTADHPFEDIRNPEIKNFMKTSLDFLRTGLSKEVQEGLRKKQFHISAMRDAYRADWNAALKGFLLALKNDPSDNEIERQIGNCHIELKQYQEAVNVYNDALAHGNWRRGEIAKKKCLAYATLGNIEGAVSEMRVLKNIGFGWFDEKDYQTDAVYKNVIDSRAYKRLLNE